MKNWKNIAYAFCLIGLLLGTQAWGVATPRMALVIGNAAYDGDAALKNSVNDATDVATELKKVGWNVTLVTDVDRRGFNRALVNFRDSLAAQEGANALFYYAGHGMQADGANYLIPVRTQFDTLDDVKADAISVQSVTEAIQQAGVGVSLIVLDACRDNPFAKKMSRSLGGTRGLTVVQGGGGASGSAIMFSTSPGDVALDGAGRNGVFTTALLKYIDSDMKIEDLFKKVTGDVRVLSAGAQNPWINASLSADFYLVADEIRLARLAEAQKIVEGQRQLELQKAVDEALATSASKIAELAKLQDLNKTSDAKMVAQARKEAEVAKQAAADAQSRLEADQKRPKGKVRIESTAEGSVFIGKQLLGRIGPMAPLMSDSLAPGDTEFTLVVSGSPDSKRTETITELAYVTVVFGSVRESGNSPAAQATRTLISEDLVRNQTKIQGLSSSLDVSQKQKIYAEYQVGPVITWAGFLINAVPLPISFGSMVQGDWESFYWTSGLKTGGIIAFLYSQIGHPQGEPGTFGDMVVGIVGLGCLLGGEVYSLVAPWDHATKYNRSLREGLNIDIVVEPQPGSGLKTAASIRY